MEEYLDKLVAKSITDDSLHFVCDPSKMLHDPGVAYVYSDIVEPQYVGNTKAQLLRVIHFPKDGRVISFPSVHYIPLNNAQFRTVRVYIRDVEGNPYPFTPGTACLLYTSDAADERSSVDLG